MAEKLVEVKENDKSYYSCGACEQITVAEKAISFRTSGDSVYTLRYCNEHYEQLKSELNRA